jgi:hypothetical protein
MPFEIAPSGGQLRGTLQYLVDFGFLDFVLPFILIFTLIFAILQMTKVFSVKKKVRNAQGQEVEVAVGDRKLNALIGLAIALMLTIPHAAGIYPPDMDPITLMSSFLPSTAVVLMAVFVIILLLGFAGASEKNALQLLIAAIGVGLLVFLFIMNLFPTFFPTFGWLMDPTIQALLFVLLIMALVVYWVMKPESKPGESVPKTLRKWMTVQHPPGP